MPADRASPLLTGSVSTTRRTILRPLSDTGAGIRREVGVGRVSGLNIADEGTMMGESA